MATTKLRPARRVAQAVGAVVAAGALLTVAGCSSTSSGSGSSTSSDALSGELTLLVSSADASDAAFKEVNEAFEAANPDVTVTLTSVPNDSYPATKAAQLTAGQVDLFVVKTFREVPDYAADSTSDDVQLAEAGGLVDLTDESFMDDYTESVLDSQAIDGKQYAVPTGLSYSTGVFYNKTIFTENGIDVPTTWTELTDAMATLQAAGVTPFGIGGKDTWPAGLVMLGAVNSLYPTAEDKEQLAADLWSQDVSLTDDTPLSVLEKTQEVFDNAQDNFSGAGYDDMPAAFARGEFAMLPDGTWDAPTIDTAVADAFDYGYFPFPGSDDAEDNAYLSGKIELQLAIPTTSTHQDLAKAWLAFFSQSDVYAQFVATSGYSSAQPDIEQSDFLNSISDYTSTFQPAWDSVWIANNDAGEDAVYPFNYPALSPLGASTAEQAAEAAQTAWSAGF
ncbi:MAG TPA: extracellular solute-binding protein [Cellulomonas sp.]